MTVAGKRYVDCSVLDTGSTADAEDSSYDSDYEVEDSIGSTNVPSQLEFQVSSPTHSDVSRTTSDTLAAEFAEYVTVHRSSSVQNAGYTARVEFALKLGYTERLVQAALQKLGPDPGQNELLGELIKLGATCSQKPSDPSEESESFLDTDLPEEESGSDRFRPVVIDGSNVAMSHGNKKVFSCRGIQICVDWFKARGHREITVFVPKWRKETSRIDNPITDQEILGELERDRLLVFTPSRLVGGKRMVCYDDRYILRLAAEIDGIVVSNDNYRDLAQENPEFRKVVEERILMYSFVNDRFMPPDDPLGRSGPTLENFLRTSPRKVDLAPPCPYAKKCTYGTKCKFRHPERGPHSQKSVTEQLVEHAQKHLQARGPSLSLPLSGGTSSNTPHRLLCKARSVATVHSLSPAKKSGSVDNVTNDQTTNSLAAYGLPPAPNPQGYHPTGRTAGRTANTETKPPNLHRKLQRQLTLNPSCDPRLSQLKKCQQASQQQSSQAASASQQSPICSSSVTHRPLSRHTANEPSYPAALNWDHSEILQDHEHLTRIASAPDSYQAWPSRNTNVTTHPETSRRLGASDPQLNLAASSLFSGMSSEMLTQFLDTRTKIHYHLTNIFPEEQVRTVMAIHPFETDPKQICAAVLKMYQQ